MTGKDMRMQRPEPIENEIAYDGATMITETDAKGIITYVNRKFIQMSGYARDELIGQAHSIMRHPDMPKVIFQEMWANLKNAEPWKGYIKNLRKDGSFYWVVVFITPKHDDVGNLSGFIAARELPGPQTLAEIKTTYAQYKAEEPSS
jgi:PAS domain S-box-containing protein